MIARNTLRARMPDDGDGSISLLGFFLNRYAPELLQDAALGTHKGYLDAIKHLDRSIGRGARLADLTSEKLAALVSHMRDAGKSPATAAKARHHLLRLAAIAHRWGLLPARPTVAPVVVDRAPPAAWTIAELNRIIGAARTMPGSIGETPAGLWWPALIYLLLDTGASAPELLSLGIEAYDRTAGKLATREYVVSLHSLTLQALEVIRRAPRQRLLPWPLDNARPPYHMLYREFRALLWRAGLPHVRANLFDRMRITAATVPEALDRVNPHLRFRAREGKPKLPRARDRRNWEKRASPIDKRPAPAPTPRSESVVVIIAHASPRTLLRFFENQYRRLKLVNASPTTAASYRSTISRAYAYAACEVSLDGLTEDFIEGLMAWTISGGRAAATANRYRAELLALWQYARRKHWLKGERPYVDKLRELKRIPDAWSMAQLGALLHAAAAMPGEVCGIPAGVWWPALLLTIYDTGLRLSAALAIQTRNLNVDTGHVMALAETQKQKADQLFRLHPDTLQIVRQTRPQEREKLFPWNGNRKRLIAALRSILNRAGLPTGKRDLFHKLRRTSATFIADALSEDAARRHLGHSDQKITQMYLDPTKIRGIDASSLLPRPVYPSE